MSEFGSDISIPTVIRNLSDQEADVSEFGSDISIPTVIRNLSA